MRIGYYMTQSPITVSEQTSMKEAVLTLQRHRIRHLPVTNGTKLVGIVTDRDLKRASPSLLLEIEREEVEQVLRTTSVSSIMTREPVTATPDTPLVDALRLMVEGKFGSIPVVNGDDLVGIFTEIDALKVLIEKEERGSGDVNSGSRSL
jgi:acetoin utilization protein AcuB